MSKPAKPLGKRWWWKPLALGVFSFGVLMELISWVNHDRDVAVSIAQVALCLIWLFVAFRIATWSDTLMRIRRKELETGGDENQ